MFKLEKPVTITFDMLKPASIQIDRLPNDMYEEFGRHARIDSYNVIERLNEEGDTIFSYTRKAYVDAVQQLDDALFETICKTAKEAGFTDVYVLNKEFIITAIQNELNRRQK